MVPTILFIVFLPFCKVHAEQASSEPSAPWTEFETSQPTVNPNIDDDTVNAFLNHDRICRFYSSDSNTVDSVVETDRVMVVEDANDLLKKCRVMEKKVGSEACSAIELAGHAYRQSIGLGGIVGIRHWGDNWVFQPNDDAYWKDLSSCFRSITRKNAPVIFSTCGGVVRDGIHCRFYPGKAEASAKFFERIGLPVVSAIGPCRATALHDGTICEAGWYASNEHSLPEVWKSITHRWVQEAGKARDDESVASH